MHSKIVHNSTQVITIAGYTSSSSSSSHSSTSYSSSSSSNSSSSSSSSSSSNSSSSSARRLFCKDYNVFFGAGTRGPLFFALRSYYDAANSL